MVQFSQDQGEVFEMTKQSGAVFDERPSPYAWQQSKPETFFDAFDKALDDIPEQVFLDFDEGTITFREVDVRSTRLAHSLSGLGVVKGDRVVTILETSADAISIWFAVNKIGAIWVPINTAYRGEFLRHQVADADARVLVCEDIYLERVIEIAPELERPPLVLCRGDFTVLADAPIVVASLDEHRGRNETPIDDRPKPQDIACLIYTSGTTGRSKGCMISHNYLCNGARQQNMSVPPLPGEITWTCLPTFHVSAVSYVIIATMLAQTRARLVKRFSVSDFWFDLERSGASTAMLMASMFPLLAQAPDNEAMTRWKGRLRAVTGVPVTEEVRKIWHDRFGVGHVNSFGYGQTEGSKICNMPWGEKLPPLTSAGKPASDFEVKIVGPDDLPVPQGVAGQILIRPRRPNIMFAGYWRRPDDTVKVWKDLWMHTGDVGKFDEEGYLYFVDRQKDYVRSRGENISSLEVEALFMTHPDVSEVAFHSVRASSNGEEDLMVTVVRHAQATVTAEELCHWSIAKLPYFAVPRFFEFCDRLPKTPTGRVQKQKLRDQGQTPTTWDAHKAGIVVRRSTAQ